MSEKKDSNLFQNRELVIATKHGKEGVIAPLFLHHFGLPSRLARIDTDMLGTFSGEIKRRLSPLDAAREKCRMALDTYGGDLAISSEGSFGSHPEYFFLQANEELILLVDQKAHVEYIGRHLSTDTNFAETTLHHPEELQAFKARIGFPSHGLIVKDKAMGFKEVHKDIVSEVQLHTLVETMFEKYRSLHLESDLRAMRNPTRMKNIEKACLNLIEKLQSLCPSCHSPGFWIREAIAGLPCAQCFMPTRSTLQHVYGCLFCDHSETRNFPHDKQLEDPMYCDFCNP